MEKQAVDVNVNSRATSGDQHATSRDLFAGSCDARRVDVVIIGGGLIGLSLSLLLKTQGLSVILLESKPFQEDKATPIDARNIALSSASVAILKAMGVWAALTPHACPIESIHVSNQGRFGSTVLNRPESHPLGYVIELAVLQRILLEAVPKDVIWAPAEACVIPSIAREPLDFASRHGQEIPRSARDDMGGVIVNYQGQTVTIDAKVIVAADGANSKVREHLKIIPNVKDFHQTAIVANIALTRAHDHQAYERFTREGPLALLPLTDKRMAMVWAMENAAIDNVMALDDKAFLLKLKRASGHRLGNVSAIGSRQVFPLKQTVMSETVFDNIVFIGNAAQSLHPIAGQGFNLGLRDVATLMECLSEKGVNPAALKAYQGLRKPDTALITRFTDNLISLFTSDFPGVQWASGLGLSLMDNSASLQKMLARMASGYAGNVPYLARREV